ncbi:ABC transporter ATP-binding protein [Pyrodictium abyssi]
MQQIYKLAAEDAVTAMPISTISVVGVAAGYRGKPVIRDVDVEFRGPGVHAIIGPNGSGKTTLLRVITGVIRPYRGDVLFDGRSIHREPEVKRLIGYMPAEIGLLPRLTLYENLETYLEILGYDRGFLEERLEALGRVLPLDDILHRMVGAMSTGQRVRAGLVRTLIHDPEVVVLDEPTRGLDIVLARQVREMLQDIARDRMVIMTTHLAHELLELSSHVTVMKSGRVLFSGSIDEFRRSLADRPVTLHIRTATPIDDVLENLGVEFQRKAYSYYIVRLPSLNEAPRLLTELPRHTGILELREDLDELVKALYEG